MHILWRVVFSFYAALVILAAAWAWFAAIKFLHSTQEHLLPQFMLGFVTFPTSMLIALVPMPSCEIVGVAWLTAGGAFQLWVVYRLVRPAFQRA
jgi:hypothetical protein